MKPQFIDHLVFVVKDISVTERFYSVFLGKPAYFEAGQLVYQLGETRLFFVIAKGKWAPGDKDQGGLNHIAFGVRTIEELHELEATLKDKRIKNSGVSIDKHGKKEYIWFDDPNGMRLEFYCRPVALN
jgi:glyoxylase I family protein